MTDDCGIIRSVVGARSWSLQGKEREGGFVGAYQTKRQQAPSLRWEEDGLYGCRLECKEGRERWVKEDKGWPDAECTHPGGHPKEFRF